MRLPILPADEFPINSANPTRQLFDRQGRKLSYLRISVTDRCDLRCQYCMPAEGVAASPKNELLSFEEIVRLVRIFRPLGVQTVRLSGGEPLLRKDIVQLVEMIRDEAGIEDIAMTTNATALAHHANDLVKAGLSRINVSVDSLDPARFAELTRGGDLAKVLRGIDAIQQAGLREIKSNTVVVRGTNDDELLEIVRWAWAKQITPRFIELMPLGAGASLGAHSVFSCAEMKTALAELFAPGTTLETPKNRGPAHYLATSDAQRVGFIGAVTEKFCDGCNRLRITARGQVRACLASPEGVSLRDLLHRSDDDAEIAAHIAQLLFEKRDGHAFYAEGVTRHHDVHMSHLGG